MGTNSSDNDDSDGDSDSSKNNQSVIKLRDYKNEILINIEDKNENVGYIKGVLLNTEHILKELKSDEVLKVLEFNDKEDEEEIKSFYIQVLSKGNCKDNTFYINELFIEKEHRGNGIGRRIFDDLPQLLYDRVNRHISCIYLMPGPLEKVDGEVKYIMNTKDEQMIVLKEKLIKFYKSIGFKRIGNTDFYHKDQII